MKNAPTEAASTDKASKKASPAGTQTSGGSQLEETAENVRESLRETGSHLREDASALAQSFGYATQEFGTYMREQLQSRPYLTLGAAAGIGFVLGGGLSVRLGSMLLTNGARFALGMFLREAFKPDA